MSHRIIGLGILILSAFSYSHTLDAAEKINLKVAGKTFRGEVLKLGKRDILFKTQQGKKETIPLVFLTPKDLYLCRRSLLGPKDAKGHYELGLYCKKNNLQTQAEKEFLDAITIDPATYRAKVKAIDKDDFSIGKAKTQLSPKRTRTAKNASRKSKAQPAVKTRSGGSGQIDQFIANRLREDGIPSSKKSTDVEFLRRVYLDVVGIIPNALAIQKFMADRSSNKRAKVIDELLASPHYGRHWSVMWGDMLKEHTSNSSQEGTVSGSYRRWIRDALNKDMPYDEFVTKLITAKGTSVDDAAANFYLRDRNDRVETINTISNTFMGTRMSCAQCHDHPFDRWEQKDFNNLKAFVNNTRVDVDFKQTAARMLALSNEVLPANIKSAIKSVIGEAPAKDKGKGKGKKRKKRKRRYNALKEIQKKLSKKDADLLRRMYYRNRVSKVTDRGGRKGIPQFPWDPAKKAKSGHSPREALASFIVQADLFPKVHVNHLWARLAGRGLVSPVDDFRPKNEASHPELLDYLASELTKNKFDSKHVIRLILNSETYQRSTLASKANKEDRELFSHQRLRRMTAEQLYDSILVSTGRKIGIPVKGASSALAPKDHPDSKWAFDVGGPARFGSFMQSFHQPDREQLVYERESSASITQALELFNGRAINNAIQSKDGTFSKALLGSGIGIQNMVVQLYLSTLSRYPTSGELGNLLRMTGGSASKTRALEDIHWALLNSREFMFIK